MHERCSVVSRGFDSGTRDSEPGILDILGPRPRWKPVPVDRVREPPYAGIARIVIHIVGPDQSIHRFFAGTGWFAARNRVVTAAHVIDVRAAWRSVEGARSWHIEIDPAASHGASTIWATRAARHPRFVEGVVSDADIAILVVPDIGTALSVWCMRPSPVASLAESTLTLTGYPSTSGDPPSLREHEGAVLAQEGALAFYDIDSEGGQSGSPLRLSNSIVGIHIGGQGAGQSSLARSLNVGIAFDNATAAWIMAA